MKKLRVALLLLAAAVAVGGAVVFMSREEATVAVEDGYGPNPKLPPPNPTLIPTLNFATASPWPEGMKPKPAGGFEVTEFARGLEHPRMLHVLPNGDVLVAESNKPKAEVGFSFRGWIEGLVMGRAGAGTASANRITLLRDQDRDGTAETSSIFLEGLNSPFGMALIGSTLYVANADAVVAFPYQEGALEIAAPGEKIVDLPAGRNHHWTKDLIASRDGTKLYVTVGSNSNVAENGMEEEEGRAAVHEIDLATRGMRQFASGLRNPNGLAWNPDSWELWVVVNERDEIGSDLVPDYMTSVREGGFYGWPYAYWGPHEDPRRARERPDLVAQSIVPDFSLGAHAAPISVLFARALAGDALVTLHGSWNRASPHGYEVWRVHFEQGSPVSATVFVRGWRLDDERVWGRPAGLAEAPDGSVLLIDDGSRTMFRLRPPR